MAKTGADKLREWALAFDGLDAYQFGEVPFYEPKNSDPRDGDCSGACFAWWRRGGVPAAVLGGRQTADDYSRRGHTIASKDAVCGDYIVLLNNDGHAHHIIMCSGKGDTMEAKGEQYGYVRSTVAKCMERGRAHAKRMPKVHDYLGNLTGAAVDHSPPPHHPVWPNRYLHLGMRDKDDKGAIHVAQRRLRDRRWRITVNGSFGSQTEGIVKQFRRQKHLEIDGEIGPFTWNALWEAPITKD
jgi:peptidoglycan hydrolase-like protein with peptidoglycan-binding domain